MFVAGEDGKENDKRVGEKSGGAVGETAKKDADAIKGLGKVILIGFKKKEENKD